MKAHRILIAALLSAIILSFSGCAPRTPAASSPSAPSDRQEEQPSSDSNEKEPEGGSGQEEPDNPDDNSLSPDQEEGDDPEEKDSENEEEASAKETVYKLPGSTYQVTIQPPFVAAASTTMETLIVTSSEDATLLGSIYNDPSLTGMEQLESSVKTMEQSIQEDPTITDFKKEVSEGKDGLFSFTFTYSGGETEGSPAGFYYIHYQKTPDSLLTANFSCARPIFADDIKALFNSIVPATGDAVDAPPESQ